MKWPSGEEKGARRPIQVLTRNMMLTLFYSFLASLQKGNLPSKEYDD